MKQKLKNWTCNAMVMIFIAMLCTADSYDTPLSLCTFIATLFAWTALTAVAVKRWYKIPEKYDNY
jgi:hypothetical protein